MENWAMIQTWRQPSEDLRREAEIRRRARALRKGSPKRYRRLPIRGGNSRYGGRVLKSFGRKRDSV